MPTTTKPKRRKPRPTTPTEMSNYQLRDAAEFAAGFGNLSKIATTMTDLTGSRVTHQMVSRWLNQDPEKRQQPSLGTGLLLLIAVQKLKTEQTFTDITIRLP